MKKTKLFAILFTVVLLCATLAIGTLAAENVVYLVDGGSGDGSSASSPLGDMAESI